MTCIAGLVHDGIVYLGGDSAGVSDVDLTRRADPKVFVKGGFVFGFAGSFRMGQLLHYTFKPPVMRRTETVEQYMVTRFIDAVRLCLKKGGYAHLDKNEQEEGGTFLVGFRGHLFCIDSDYQVGEAIDKYDAIGAGGNIAKGALFALQGSPLAPTEKLRAALEASERWSGAVCAPFRYASTPGPKKGSQGLKAMLKAMPK